MTPRLRRCLAWAAPVAAALAIAAGVVALNHLDEAPPELHTATTPAHSALASPAASASQVERGAYLARAGNCAACHTARGGTAYAGGRGITTPFGTVYSSNLTPDATTGLGRWSAWDFWRALHNGRSKDGRLLYPAFPYPNTTRMSRGDSDALYAYLQSLPPAEQPNRPHALRFPYGSQLALAGWRALYFRPGVHVDEPARSAEWNRGAYLVRGLAHCSACHGGRNVWGGPSAGAEFAGSLLPGAPWYAPALTDPSEASVAHWPLNDTVALLRDGRTADASVLGPMAEVVYSSTQHLTAADLRAMATYLKALPVTRAEAEVRGADAALRADPAARERGARHYEQHCAQCHGDSGEGAPGVYPALAGNRAVTMASPANLLRVVIEGAYLPATAGNPRPYGMPPFRQQLSEAEIADVLTYIRGAGGNAAPPVSALDVVRLR